MILVDTTPLVALCDPRDSLHQRAMSDLDKLAKQPLFACTPVLTEACLLLTHSVHRQRLERLISELPIRTLLLPDEADVWGRVLRWLEKYAEHQPDFADGYLAVASELNRKCRIWTYDSEFRTLWRRPDGTKIPLTVR